MKTIFIKSLLMVVPLSLIFMAAAFSIVTANMLLGCPDFVLMVLFMNVLVWAIIAKVAWLFTEKVILENE